MPLEQFNLAWEFFEREESLRVRQACKTCYEKNLGTMWRRIRFWNLKYKME